MIVTVTTATVITTVTPYYDRDAYYDRDWRRDRYDRWNDYRDRDDSYRSSRIDPLRNNYND